MTWSCPVDSILECKLDVGPVTSVVRLPVTLKNKDILQEKKIYGIKKTAFQNGIKRIFIMGNSLYV